MKWLNLILPVSLLFFSDTIHAQVYGCTDPLAVNYNPAATSNDGSCTYSSASVAPSASFVLGESLSETSGLIKWHDLVWTHNDNDDINIYSLDTLNGNLTQTYPLTGATNVDWEEISQDEDYVYIGDFGNNSNGNRTNLKIFRIDKNSILNNSPVIETISFSYSDQTNFTPAGANNTDFDCEALIVSADSIYLFTKQWISNKTCVYSLPKTPGTHIAQLKSTFDVQGLITGATYLESKKLVTLCGYTNLLQPFIYLLYDFHKHDFFGGNKRKVTISRPFHQVEGIASTNGLKYYISNEYSSQPLFITTQQKLLIFNLGGFLEGYLNNVVTQTETQKKNTDLLFPNPSNDFIHIKTDKYHLPVNYQIINRLGQIVQKGKLTQENQGIDISGLAVGMHILNIGNDIMESYKLMKK